jgi:hypothetical protein
VGLVSFGADLVGVDLSAVAVGVWTDMKLAERLEVQAAAINISVKATSMTMTRMAEYLT